MIKTANLVGSVSRDAGGLFESVRRLVQSLAAAGMDVRVFSTEDEHTAADIGLWAPVTVQAFPVIGPRQWGYSPQYRRALNELLPDIVHTHGIWTFPSIATNQYRGRQGVPYVISAHGMLDPWALRNSRWKKVIAYFFYEFAHLREASCLRALCEAEARAIRQAGLKNPIAIIPNGIDLPAEVTGGGCQVTGSDKQQGTISIGEQVEGTANSQQPTAYTEGKQGRKVLLYLGRIHPKKGLVNLLRAWAAVSKEQGARSKEQAWVLAIAGWDQGGHEAELKRLATELGIAWQDAREHRTSNIEHPTSNIQRAERTEVRGERSEVSAQCSVVFLGPRFGKDKAACYRHCDGFILPSFSEGVPMVVLEAWAHRKPVLMTPECNLPAGFARGAAIRIETDAESIARGLREFFQASDAQHAALGDNGLRLIREQFAWPHLAQEMKQLYEWLLGGGVKPDCVTDY